MSELVSLKSSFHGRERRGERQISKDDAKLARRYGMIEMSQGGLRKYTFRGSVFVLNNSRNQEVTCYHSKDYASPFSGTRVTLPCLYPMEEEYTSEEQLERHKTVQRTLLKRQSYASHSVFCLSMSSLMRQDDVNGARCRSDAVWAALARGFVHSILFTANSNRKQNQKVNQHVVSVVVLMESHAKIVLRWEPLDGVLFNKLIYLREWSTLRPQGKALITHETVDSIQTLLNKTARGRGPITLIFMASNDLTIVDDTTQNEATSTTSSKSGGVMQRLQALSKDLSDQGRLLRTFGICLGSESDDCSALRQLVEQSDSTAVPSSRLGRVGRSTLELDSLVQLLSTFAREVTGSQESSAIASSARATSHVTDTAPAPRAAGSATATIPSTSSTASSNWTKGVIRNVYMWSELANDLVPLVDRRCTSCYSEVGSTTIGCTDSATVHQDATSGGPAPKTTPTPTPSGGGGSSSSSSDSIIPDPNKGWLCASCEARHYCVDCMTHFVCHLGSIECAQLQSQRMAGRLLGVRPTDPPPSYCIAMEQVPSVSAALFSGQKLRFLNANKQEIQTYRPMVCRKLGQEEWETVDLGLARHYRQVCQAKAEARRIACSFLNIVAAVHSSMPSAKLLTTRKRGVRVPEAMIVTLEGGGGCFIVNETTTSSTAVCHWPACEVEPGVSMVLETLSHYSIASGHNSLVSPSKIALDENEIVLLDFVVYHNDIERRHAREAFLRSHSCNSICHSINLPS